MDYRGGETADYVYGRNGAHELTTSNRANAVKNADNLMYFIGAANQ
ncbi:M35 family metallo-endopeptidase [Luteibacter yeojuensis]